MIVKKAMRSDTDVHPMGMTELRLDGGLLISQASVCARTYSHTSCFHSHYQAVSVSALKAGWAVEKVAYALKLSRS